MVEDMQEEIIPALFIDKEFHLLVLVPVKNRGVDQTGKVELGPGADVFEIGVGDMRGRPRGGFHLCGNVDDLIVAIAIEVSDAEGSGRRQAMAFLDGQPLRQFFRRN